jgi:serine/threonine protein kinase
MDHRPAATESSFNAAPMALYLGGADDDSGLVGRIIAGGLRVTAQTGSSPQGPLYEAEDPEGRRVALLILPPRVRGQEPAAVRSLRLAAKIRHPNVAAVHALGDLEDGSTYVVLEEPVGEPLLSLLGERSALPIGEALELILQVVSGLEAVHQLGFIHGNVSPNTILVTRPPFGKSQVKLVGFHPDTDLQHVTSLEPGGEPYASPERLQGSLPDVRYDVFSVGAVLHHLLSGSPPSEGRRVGNVPRIARPVLEKALAGLPGGRFQRMSELREALEALAAAAVTPPEDVAYRKVLVRAIGAGVVLAAAGLLLAPVWSSIEVNWSKTETLPARTEPVAVAPRDSSIDAVGRAPSSSPRGGASGSRDEATRRAATRTEAPRQRAIEPSRDRATEERNEGPEPLGYVGQPRGSDVSPESGQRTPPPPSARSTPLPPRPPPSPPPRPRAVLEQDPGLRQAMGDITRIGLAENIAELRPGVLIVELAPGGMGVPSASYNLQRLYLAYSAASRQQDTVAIELRRNGALYGRFTRAGLLEAKPTTGR